MRYNQPYGLPEEVAEGDHPFVNGNPSIGLAGSIPPAEAIEYTQREIANFIKDNNLEAPSNNDLRQMAKAIQSGLTHCCDDQGTANQYQVTLKPVPEAYYKYMRVVMQVAHDNTGPSTLNVNALGGKEIINQDGSQMAANQLTTGAIVCFQYDGTKFKVVWAQTSVKGMPVFLTAPKTLYVNYATGNDAWDGTLAAFGTGIAGPVKTLQRASDIVAAWNLNGYDVTVNVADSLLYAGFNLPASAGDGNIYWVGNAATPANVTITGTSRSAISCRGTANKMTGFKVQTSGPVTSDPMNGIHCQGSVEMTASNFEWGACSGSHNFVYGGAYLRLGGPKRITGGSTGNSFAQGCFIAAQLGGKVDFMEISPAQPMTLVGTPAFATAFVYATGLASAALIWSVLTGSATGTRYGATYNGVINVSGGGASYLPGSVAGSVSTGGQYG